MKYVDDITKLFTRFGANTETYQEIQPNYKDFKDDPITPVLPKPEPSVVLPSPTSTPTPAAFLPDEPQPSLLIGAPRFPLLTEPPASSGTGDRQRLSDLLRELNQVRRDGLPETTRKRTKAKVIAIVSANGGVGKSTVAAGLAKTLRRPGGRTIAIDLDPQNALSSHLGITRQVPGLIQLKEQDADWGAHRLPGFSDSECLPFGTGEMDDRHLLRQLMLEDSDWLNQHLASMNLSENDTVILDTPSGATVYSQQALDAADLVLVMTVADAASYLALDTMTQWLETTRRRGQRHRYVLNQRDDSRTFSRDMGVLFVRRLGADLIGTIRLDHQFNESLAYGRDLLQYAPESIGCHDILSLSGAVHALLFADTCSQQGTP
ncbi:cellulose biosynthesis protein BcsQ [Pseudomonas sp. Tn43]|uniref:cellulose biosynthesis protein BcsQ n=1 Tax=Pseudomonas sp. Tn43 TaxID=701213 RepID=UPI00160E9BC8|nr:cellulose biosynthesis protein BcsQ [Pseudomonas sp. Tn43]